MLNLVVKTELQITYSNREILNRCSLRSLCLQGICQLLKINARLYATNLHAFLFRKYRPEESAVQRQPLRPQLEMPPNIPNPQLYSHPFQSSVPSRYITSDFNLLVYINLKFYEL